MENIQVQPIHWLWEGWLPLGKMTILAGAGGCGKTNLSLALISTITRGGNFPDGVLCENSGKVLIYSTEDDSSEYYTVQEAMKKYSLTRDSVYGILQFHEIKREKKGRFVRFLKVEFDHVMGARK